jgi:hypothetical protein
MQLPLDLDQKSLKEVSALAHELLMRESDLALAEQVYAMAKQALNKVAEIDLPEAMKELGLTQISVKLDDDGPTYSIGYKGEIYASVPDANKRQAFEWLERNGAESLIKTELKVAYGRGELQAARELAATLRAQGAAVQVGETVHTGTLKAFIRERLEEKKPIPLELFGARSVDRAFVKVK